MILAGRKRGQGEGRDGGPPPDGRAATIFNYLHVSAASGKIMDHPALGESQSAAVSYSCSCVTVSCMSSAKRILPWTQFCGACRWVCLDHGHPQHDHSHAPDEVLWSMQPGVSTPRCCRMSTLAETQIFDSDIWRGNTILCFSPICAACATCHCPRGVYHWRI